MATAAGARGRGLAARLMEEGIALCEGYPITLGAQAYLEDWYARFGFRRSGPDYVEDGIPHLPMRLPGSVPGSHRNGRLGDLVLGKPAFD